MKKKQDARFGRGNRAASHWRGWRWLAGALALSLLAGCAVQEKKRAEDRYARAKALFAERCKTAGEFIHRTVEDVEGIYMMRLRPRNEYGEGQYEEDPYGRDYFGEDLIASLLRDFHFDQRERGVGSLARGFQMVEARSPTDGRLYRYTGSIRTEEYGGANKFFARNFRLDRKPIESVSVRYGVTYEDISTIEDRAYWIAGGALRVVDLKTGEILGERIGYLMDGGQGNSSGGRKPWLLAAKANACPVFDVKGWGEVGQTARFAEKVLFPK